MMHMNNSMIKLAGVVSACAMLAACGNDFSNPVGDTSSDSGSADLSKFVALGDSLTAGYADSALYKMGQENSYPAILAGQFEMVGGGEFSQPLMSDNLGGLLIGGNPLPDFGNRLVLNAATESPEAIEGDPMTDVAMPLTGSFNNMGVPGAKSYHLRAPGYGALAGLTTTPATANPYFVRFASSTSTTMIADAAGQQPSFIVLWIGNNDVLSYATGGGTGADQTGNPDPTTYGLEDITDPTAFAGIYSQLVGAFTTANPDVQGVLVNIPDVKSIPFFTTVPHNPVPLDQATADQLNTAYAAYNGGLDLALAGGASAIGLTQEEVDARKISFSAGAGNAVVILDEDLTDLTTLSGVNPAFAALTNMRQATAEDLLVLTSRLKIGEESVEGNPASVWGLGVPLADEDVLVASEITAIETATAAFNAAISSAADANPNLVLFDASAKLAELKASGIDYETGLITATYATGGGFSLDGVHPTARGYAVVANGIIDTINSTFEASIPRVDPGAYSTVFLK
jgi:lysophospholipase L1-like esterase